MQRCDSTAPDVAQLMKSSWRPDCTQHGTLRPCRRGLTQRSSTSLLPGAQPETQSRQLPVSSPGSAAHLPSACMPGSAANLTFRTSCTSRGLETGAVLVIVLYGASILQCPKVQPVYEVIRSSCMRLLPCWVEQVTDGGMVAVQGSCAVGVQPSRQKVSPRLPIQWPQMVSAESASPLACM